MTEKQKLSQKLADNLAFFIRDPSKRCVLNESIYQVKCKYSGKTLGLKTPGCFIGRLIPSASIRLELDNLDIGDVTELISAAGTKIKGYIPKIILNNRLIMLRFQGLHDADSNWSDTGLSPKGKRELESILNRYDKKLNRTPFRKFL